MSGALRRRPGTAAARGAARVVDWIDILTIVTAGALLLGLSLVMFVGVVFRYALNNALPWSDELAGFMLAWAAFLGAPIALRRAYHPAITLVADRLQGAPAVGVAVVRESLVGAYLVLLLVAGVEMATGKQLPHAVALPLTFAVPYAAIPTSAVLMLVQWVRSLAIQQRWWAFAVVPAGGVIGILLIEISQAPPDWLAGLPFPPLLLLLPLLFALGMPIAMVLGLFSVVALALQGGIPLTIATQRLFSGINNPAFLAIPAFMLTGSFMEVTEMSHGLVNFAAALVGRFPGGLALADVVASVLFADTSGSAVADTAAIGTVMMPGMRSRGYRDSFVAAHQAAAGSLGTLFPPSISMIIFATVTSISVITLFQSSIIPGLLVALSYMAVAYVVARRENYPREPALRPRALLRTVIVAIPALMAPVVVLGGILLGVFAPYEAGAIALFYVLLVGFVSNVHRHPKHYGRAILQAVQTTAMVMFIIANATILAWVLVGFEVPQTIAATIAALSHNPVATLVLVSLFLVALSIFLEPPAILVAVVPIVLPLVQKVGVDAYHFGVVVMLAGAIGMLLPPIGITLLVSIGILGTAIERAAKAAIPYVLIASCDLLLVILVPPLTSWLPHLLVHRP